eukprot:gene3843-15139_t
MPRFGVNGRKRKRDVEVAEKVQEQECDVTQPEKKMRQSVSDNARTIKANEFPLNKDSFVAGWAENQAKFPSKRKDPSRSSINILRLVKRSENYYTCEIINTTGEAKKQPTRDHSKDSCLGQNLAANSLSKNRNCSAQVACLDKVEQVKVEVVQEATKSSFARVFNVGQRQRRKLLSIFSHFAHNYGLFLNIAKHLTETSSDDHDVIKQLSDSSFRRSVFTKLKHQADFCFKDLIFLNALADDESINSRLKKFGKVVRKTMKSLDRLLATVETIDRVDNLVNQSEDIPRFDVHGRKRKRSVEVAEKVQAPECDVTQPERKRRHSVSDNVRTIKANEIPFNESSYVAGWAENHAKFPSKGKDTSRSSINILRLVKRNDNYYTCEIINTTRKAKKQPTRDLSKDSCLGQNLAANYLSKNRNCSAQVACLDKVEQVKVEVVQEATKSSLARNRQRHERFHNVILKYRGAKERGAMGQVLLRPKDKRENEGTSLEMSR